MNLMIIESAGKVKKIKELLGSNYIVAATLGHFKELDNAGIDNIGFNENYEPIFKFSDRGTKTWENINQLLKKYNFEKIYIASDPDREGEAIAWHVFNNLTQENKKKSIRIRFNEITFEAINEAIKNPDTINQNLVNAQFCRQIYDKDFGFKISRFIKYHTKEAKSLGRVQGVVVKLLNDRTNEIKDWKPIYKQRIKISVLDKDKKVAKLSLVNEKLTEITFNQEENISITNEKELFLKKIITNNNIKTNAPKPYKTSTFLQDIIKKLKLSSKEAQKCLQVLYEKGLITYPRTDSFTISETFCDIAKAFIRLEYSEKYINNDFKQYKNSEGAQEGHECLRITHFEDIEKIDGISDLNADSKDVYKMLYKRTLAMFMSPIDAIEAIFMFNDSKNNLYICKSKKIIFDGWKTVYKHDIDNEENNENEDSFNFTENEYYKINEFKLDKFISNPCPKLFKEADIIKQLEDKQIGRPSTFAMYSGVVLDRGYAILNDKNELELTSLGKEVQSYIDNKDFKINEFINYEFTANFEKELDLIASNKLEYKTVISKYHKLINDRYLFKQKFEGKN